MHIHAITLATDDLVGQAAFWEGTLGLPVARRSSTVEVSLRRSTLRFEQAMPGSDPRYHFAINIPPGTIKDAATWLEQRHDLLAFQGDPDVDDGTTIVHTDRGASAFYFLDAAGNVVELIANDHLEDEADAAFGPESLLEVAEIGIATADTEATRGLVQAILGADILWGGREGRQLTAIGDDHGVVIVAPAGRGWIPVGLPARPLPTAIVAQAPQAAEARLPEGPYHIRGIPPDPTAKNPAAGFI
jgi:catechol 2,3-dioxygenase-like lactoylglutathione lyase family enzyme